MEDLLVWYESPLVWGGVGVLVGLVIGIWLLYNKPFLQSRRFPKCSEVIVETFIKQTCPSHENYSSLVAYFAEGFLAYATPLKANASYPGYRSANGAEKDRLEGFSRIAPLLAIWLKHSQGNEIVLPSGRIVNVAELLQNAVTVGTNQASAEYWGTIEDRDQRIAEASDIALSLWLSKDRVWIGLSAAVKERISAWLLGVNGKQIADNNWHLFVVTVNIVLKALHQPYSGEEIAHGMERIKSFYQGDGWFRDGPGGLFDYYNAWGFHYQLNWIHSIDHTIYPVFIEMATALFARQLICLIGPHGFPIMGRSVCYRLAVTAPLMFAAQQHASGISLGQAKRALDATWTHFLVNGAVKEGRITQGYYSDDPRILDVYSGPASGLWSLRSLIAAFEFPAESAFWTHSGEKLPVETADFDITFESPKFRVVGTHATGEILILNMSGAATEAAIKLQPYTFLSRILEVVKGELLRPDNEKAKYHQAKYSSLKPFCLCAYPRY